jgi:5-formyltetrahydrofolate cyclo-ligase
MEKKELRKQMLKLRQNYHQDELKRKSNNILRQILNDTDYKKAKVVALFYPMKQEVNLLELINHNKIFCFPKVTKNGLVFIEYDPNVEFEQSKFGVLEPRDGNIKNKEIDYMITPALAISKDLYRIGYGKGYYDQFLANYRPKHVVGVIYDFQEINSFQIDSFDQKIDKYFKG